MPWSAAVKVQHSSRVHEGVYVLIDEILEAGLRPLAKHLSLGGVWPERLAVVAYGVRRRAQVQAIGCAVAAAALRVVRSSERRGGHCLN